MISIEEARQVISSHTCPLPSREVSLDESFQHVISEAVFSDAWYPSADRSMMDGYVVGKDAPPGVFRVTGEVAAGKLSDRVLGRGEAMRIFTGAVLPPGGDRVVMQEDCKRKGEEVIITELAENKFVRRKGSEAQPGDLILAVGTLIGASEMAMLAQVGCVRPMVRRKPRIHHLASGDELVSPGQQPGTGQIRDTNSSLIGGLLAAFALTAESTRVADDPGGMHAKAEGDWDLLLISGGASVGDHDHGAATLLEMGFTIHFDKVNLRPGKPLTFATRGNRAAFVIPGNPVSHFVCFHVAIRLAIEIMVGITPSWDFLNLKIENGEILRPNPRETFWPAGVSVKGGGLVATPSSWSTSGDTFSLTGTNALLRVKAGSPAMGRAPVLLLDLPYPAPAS